MSNRWLPAAAALFAIAAVPSPATAKGGVAAVDWDRDSIYFFQGANYRHYKHSARRVIEEKPVAGKWGCVQKPVDAAIAWGNRKLYLFFGDQYARYDMDKNACDAGYPKAIAPARNWPGLPWSSGLDAIVK